MHIKICRENIFILLIVLFAFFLRVYKVGENPPSLNWDEISLGYNAFSILETGKDEWGVKYPSIFRAYGDYKLPVYIYSLVPFIKIFGLNEFSVRLLSVLAGTITVLLTYFLVKTLFDYRLRVDGLATKTCKTATHNILTQSETNTVALLSALLVAIEPWTFFLSRGSFEANLALCLFVAGLYLFLKSAQKPLYLVPSAFFLSLTVWTYNSYRIFTPLVLVIIFLLWGKQIFISLKSRKPIIYCSLFIILLFLAPMFYQLASPEGRARYNKVSIIDEGAVSQIIQKREQSQLPFGLSRYIYNRPTYFSYKLFTNWFKHFDGIFLYINGGSQYQFNVPGRGLLYPINALFLIIGIVYLIKIRNRESVFVLIMFLLSPIASSLTREAPHTLRSVTMLPFPMIITSIGIVIVYNHFLKRKFEIRNSKLEIPTRLIFVLYSLSLIIGFISYLKEYFNSYCVGYSWSWQYGYKEALSFTSSNYSRYDKIIFTKKYGEPHEFVLFYTKWNPDKYRNDINLERYEQTGWFWIDSFDKYVFVNEWDIPKEEWQPFITERGKTVDCRNIKCLLVTDPDSVPKTWKLVKSIDFLDGKKAFEIYEN